MVCPSLKQEWGRPDLQQAWSIQKWMGKMGRPSLKQRWSTAGLRQKIGRPAFVREAVTEARFLKNEANIVFFSLQQVCGTATRQQRWNARP